MPGQHCEGGAKGNKLRLWFIPRQGLRMRQALAVLPHPHFLGFFTTLCPTAPCTLTPIVSTRVLLAGSWPPAAGISLRAQVRQKLPRNFQELYSPGRRAPGRRPGALSPLGPESPGRYAPRRGYAGGAHILLVMQPPDGFQGAMHPREALPPPRRVPGGRDSRSVHPLQRGASGAWT